MRIKSSAATFRHGSNPKPTIADRSDIGLAKNLEITNSEYGKVTWVPRLVQASGNQEEGADFSWNTALVCSLPLLSSPPLLSPDLERLSYPFSAGWTQRSNEKLTWPGLNFEPRTSNLVANCPTR
ncbi:hypothetical protein PoB_002269000 [Plakobranchus ocellatus]|uniref:Uncharacterized protein n=1 Tax=Plakobranchus ocellatus TaxID=259542 RepID=A0AAV3ZKJ1_9GAST|nr:hypothetical protein PoB_002269000 [Plakobranchus ocellatus]